MGSNLTGKVAVYTLRGEAFYDAEGILSRPGGMYYDYRGFLCRSGVDSFHDSRGRLVRPGGEFYDSQDCLIESGQTFHDGRSCPTGHYDR